MSKDDTVNNDQNAEEATELNLEDEESTESEETSEDNEDSEDSNSDPLDEIDDVEELRKRAKGYRTERNRYKGRAKEEPEDEAKTEVKAESEYLTKKDFEKANERKAIHMLQQEAGEFVKDNWEDIRQLYTPRHGKTTPEDILEDLSDAVTLFKAKNPPQEEDDSEAELATTTGKGSGAKETPKESPKNPPRFKTPTPPEEWYKKSE